jgi:hypothetical protein
VEETKKRKLETNDEHRQNKKSSAVSKGKEWSGKPNEMDRLAQGLQKLQEDDLLQVVRIVTEHKTPEMYVKNDLDGTILPLVMQVLIGRGRVQPRSIYTRRPAFANSMGFHKAEGGGIGIVAGQCFGLIVHIQVSLLLYLYIDSAHSRSNDCQKEYKYTLQ